jgi:hypothetical protein
MTKVVTQKGMPILSKIKICKIFTTKYSRAVAPSVLESTKKEAAEINKKIAELKEKDMVVEEIRKDEHTGKKFTLGFTSIKITCSAFFIFYSLIKREISFIYFLVIYFAGIFLYCFYINDFHFYQLTNQINVLLSVNESANADKAYDGISNLRVVLKIINIEKYYNSILFISIFILGKFLLNKKNSKETFLTLIILNLLLFYHAIYDFVLLIPMIAYAMKEKLDRKFKFFIYFTIFYFFYFIKINRSILNYYMNENIINLLGFIFLIFSVIILNLKKSK